MHEIAFLRFSLAKKTTRLQKVVEALLNFEEGYPFDGDQVCVSRTPRRPDLPYINPQIEDTHPFPLILSEIASEHQNNTDFAKLDGEQFCRLHSGHLRRSVHNGGNLHDARNCVSAIQPCKEDDSFAESCRSVVEF
ncbi:hypothetical protein T01_15984 [Trichinella spiralis]|uniref:Uncharacterized protein n=1 Tax=Trichinella spiralis TaxID=6334 RepID=A0A0V1BUP7_TRISP|nr:hypothetical protein T01_15984 [Trichinella spiralis]